MKVAWRAMGAGPKQRSDAVYPVLLFAGLLAVYALGASRTIFVGDSGELVTAAATLGIPHPSGYPLYVLLGWLWIRLVPLGSVALRMSLFSAVCAAGATSLLFAVGRRLELSRPVALFVALMAAWAPSLWSQANIQRVYALNALLLCAALWAALAGRNREKAGSTRLWPAFFLCGLGASNHTFMALVSVALVVFAVAEEGAAVLRVKRWAGWLAAFAAGLTPYLYLPLRSRMNPPLDWGDPQTPGRFFDVVLRRDFWDRSWLEGPRDLVPIGGNFLLGVGEETLWLGGALAVLGVAMALRKDRPVGSRRPATLLALVVIAANFVAMAFHGSRSDLFIWHRYYIPAYLMVALLAGFGLQRVVEWVARSKVGAEPVRGRALGVALLALCLPAALLLGGWRDFDRSRFEIADAYSRTLLEGLPPGAILAASDDNVLFVLLYLQWVEKVRPDVHLVPLGVGGAELPPLHFEPDREPLFFSHHPNWTLAQLDLVATGLAFQAVLAGAEPQRPPPLPPRLPGEEDPRVPKDYLTSNLVGQYHYMQGVAAEKSDWPRAQRQFAEAMRWAANNDVLFYNLGLIYRRDGLVERSLAAFERSYEINPRKLASAGNVRAGERVLELREELEELRRVERSFADVLGSLDGQDDALTYRQRMADSLDAAGHSRWAGGWRRLAEEAATGR